MPSKSISSLSLAEIHVGESAFVLSFSNGHGIAGRLTSLGFTPGAEVQMTQNFGSGPLIVTVRGTRVALGRGEAAKICVERRLE
jgi:ferrous iron transport protein A